MFAVGLAAILTELGGSATEPKLGAANVERACVVCRFGILAALGGGIAVRLTVVAAVCRSVTTPTICSAAGTINTGFIWTAREVVLSSRGC